MATAAKPQALVQDYFPRLVAWLPAVLAAGFAVMALAQVGLQMAMWQMPLDANELEAAYLTSLAKFAHGQPVYSPPGELNSTIYHPGSQLATYFLLRGLGLAGSLLAIRVVQGLFAAAGCALLVRACWRRLSDWPPAAGVAGRLLAAGLAVVLYTRLDVFGYAHPNALLNALFVAGLTVVAFPPVGWQHRVFLRTIALAGLSGALFAVKQQGLVFALALVLAWVAGQRSWRQAVLALALPLAALGSVPLIYLVLWGGDYWTWCFAIPGHETVSLVEFARARGFESLAILAFLVLFHVWFLAARPLRRGGTSTATPLLWAGAVTLPAGTLFCAKVGSLDWSFLPACAVATVLVVPEVAATLAATWESRRRLGLPARAFRTRRQATGTFAAAYLLCLAAILLPATARYYAYWTAWRAERAELATLRARQDADPAGREFFFLAHGGRRALQTGQAGPLGHSLWETAQAGIPTGEALCQQVEGGTFPYIVARPDHLAYARQDRLLAALAARYHRDPAFSQVPVFIRRDSPSPRETATRLDSPRR